jgi:hypothetical protein
VTLAGEERAVVAAATELGDRVRRQPADERHHARPERIVVARHNPHGRFSEGTRVGDRVVFGELLGIGVSTTGASSSEEAARALAGISGEIGFDGGDPLALFGAPLLVRATQLPVAGS